MSLTQHQAQVKDDVIEAINQGYRRIVLKGSAGVGKTYLVNELIKSINIKGLIYLTAPTNKALAVLKSKIDTNTGIVFSTIHSALKLKRKFDDRTGEIYFKQEYHEKYPPFKGCGLLVIDEASMVNTEILGYLKQYPFPIVFIGDEKQLNPVNELISPVFNQNWPEMELKEIIRQGKGNPIIDISRDIPKIKDKIPNRIDDIGYVYTYDRPRIIEELAQANGTDDIKYLAYTNQEVDIMNSSVRTRIYGENPGMIENGESLIFNSPYGDYFTNQEVKVESLEVREKKFSITENEFIDLKVYWINNSIFAVHEESIKDFKNASKILKTKCKSNHQGWATYYKFRENFADFKYNHAITVHKSQGSTYKNVILNVKNLNINREAEERRRLFYTGITRASNLLIFYNV